MAPKIFIVQLNHIVLDFLFCSFEFDPKIGLIFILRGAPKGHEGLFLISCLGPPLRESPGILSCRYIASEVKAI